MPDDPALDRWLERMTSHFIEQYGLPPIMARIVTWLMICEPPEQTAAAIADAIGASRASISTSMRVLVATGMVQRTSRAGDRTAYFAMHDDTWTNIVRRRLEGLAAFRRLAREGMELVGADTPRARRLEAADEAYSWFEVTLERVPGLRKEGDRG